MAGTVITAATNNINIVNGTASLDVAAACAVDVNANLTVSNATTLTGSPYTPGGTDVAVADGGTNLSSYTVGDILYASGTTTLAKLGKGALGQVLVQNSALTAPEWQYRPLTNLLTNSQWMEMSGSGLTQGSGSGRQTDFNVSNILADADGSSAASWTGTDCTITDAGANLLITQTGGGTQYAKYTCAGLTAGKLYKFAAVVANGTGAWGAGDKLLVEQNGGTLIQSLASEAAGTFSIIWEAVGATDKVTFTVTLGAGETLNLTSVYVDEVTPGYVAGGDYLAPDGGWQRSQTDTKIWREHSGTYTKAGSFYSLKVTGGATDGYLYWPQIRNFTYPGYGNLSFYPKFAGRTITLGAWIYTAAANKARIGIEQTSGLTWSSYHSGAAGWEWLEVSVAVASNSVMLLLYFSAGTANTIYLSQPMLVWGSSIGSGNYQPIPNEQVLAAANIALTGYTATTSAADAIINLEAASSGMIGKGIKAALVKAYGKDSAAGDGIGFDVQSASGVEDGISVDTQVNNIKVQGQGLVKTDANGDIYFDHRGSGAAALTIDIKVIGIQT